MLLGKFSKAEGSLVTESVPGRGLFPVPLPHSVIDREQPAGRVTSAKAEMDFRAEHSGSGPGPMMLLVVGGLRGAVSWPLSGYLINKLCESCLVHTHNKQHMSWRNVPWNWHPCPGSSPWSLLTSSVTLDESPNLSEPEFLDLKLIPISQCCVEGNELKRSRALFIMLIRMFML